MAARTTVPPLPSGFDPLSAYLDDLDRRLSALSTSAITDATGTASNTSLAPGAEVTSATPTSVDATASTNTSPYGYTTQAQADAIITTVNLLIVRQAEIVTALNTTIATVTALRSDSSATATFVNALKTRFNTLLGLMRTSKLIGS